jgi:BlaI family penicillinase repressor
MKKKSIEQLSRRERQIMNVVYREKEATVATIREAMPDPPSYSAVRALVGVLETKGYLKHSRNGRAYVYSPTVSRSLARHTALRQIVQNFFDGSVESVVAALISPETAKISDEDLARLSELIDEKRKRRSKK